MKVKLYSNLKLFEFILPSQVFGTFTFDEDDDNIVKLINIEAIDNAWYLVSVEGVKVFNNKASEVASVVTSEKTSVKIFDDDITYKVKLEENNFYVIERDNIKYLIYTEGLYDNTFKKYKYNANINLTVGKENNYNIYYDCPYIMGGVFTIKYNKLLLLEKNGTTPVYINKNIINNKLTKLNFGDVIEVFGLKIVVANGILFINNPNEKVFVNKITANIEELTLDINNNDLLDTEIKEKDLYTERDYFNKSPRIRRTIQNKEINIDTPPAVREEEEVPLIYTLGPMVTMGMTSSVNLINVLLRINSGEANLKSQWTQVVVGFAMLATTIFWPMMTKAYNKNRNQRKRREAIKKYHKYLESKKKEIQNEANLQKDILIENLVPVSECLNIINGSKLGLWSKRVEQSDFLTARIGIGTYPLAITINVPEEGFTVEEEPLKKEAMEIAKGYEKLENVPVGYSFLNNNLTAVMGSSYKVHKFMENVILQLITFHSYEDLKIVIFTDDKNSNNWSFIKNLPHNFDNYKYIRFFSSNSDDAKELSNYLEQELNMRRYDENMNEVERNYTQCRPYYLIITDNYHKLRRLGIFKALTEVNNNYGFSMIFLENLVSRLPSKCSNFISIGDKTSGILENAYEEQKNINFNDEIVYDLNMNYVAKRLSNIPIEFENGNKMLPETITFLEMEKVGKVEQLNILNRWETNDSTNSLRAEVGVDESGDIMYLDLHEKYHGPHGLIAGMTGSGKSEFIITYVLSMAINYSPNDVSFILIDYKGGGLAGAFENKNLGIKLPHLAGTITNLDKSEMDRTLVSIDSEIRRRQKIFNEARDALGESTIDIYKYQKFYHEGKLNEPVPHLIIICDEFAELKNQQPDFMDNLISVARIGRSLGVHLILATQKPTGVVDDQIWSNSKFRVCLKVQDRSDSMEMLKRPEAAELVNVGRFYLQVGYNEYFALGQSAWCGAKYFPSEKVKKNIDRSVDFINDIGYIIKSIEGNRESKKVAMGEEISNIIKYIISASKMEKLSSERLWLDNIPETILIDNLINKYNIEFNKTVEAIIGEYDDPNNQSQNILKINLNKDGNTIIYSNDGPEKELALESIIYSTTTRHSTEEINYYIVDYGSESLRKFMSFPHIGDMVFLGEDEKLNNLLKMIKEIMTERKKIFSSFGGEYDTYIKESGEKLPLIGIIINNYDAFNESNPNLEETLISYARDGQRYGVFFILTANGDNSIRHKLKQNFDTILALRLNDSQDYRTIFGRINNTPREVFGRGLFKTDNVYEFQTAKIITDDKINDYIKNVGNKLKELNSIVAKRIPTLPNIVSVDTVSNYLNGLSSVPIGISKSSLDVITYDFTNYLSTFILSTNSINTSYFSRALIKEFNSLKNTQLIVIDINKELEGIGQEVKYYYNSEPIKVMDILMDYLNKLKENPLNINIIIYFQNFNKFKSKFENSKLEEFTKNIKDYENIHLIIADDYKKLKKNEYDAWYRNIFNDTDGIWIGTGLSDQNIFKLSKISKEMGYTYKNNFGFVINDGHGELTKMIELPEYKIEGDDDE